MRYTVDLPAADWPTLPEPGELVAEMTSGGHARPLTVLAAERLDCFGDDLLPFLICLREERHTENENSYNRFQGRLLKSSAFRLLLTFISDALDTSEVLPSCRTSVLKGALIPPASRQSE